MKHKVKIKTIDEMNENHRVEIKDSSSPYCAHNKYCAVHSDSNDIFTEEFDNALPVDRIVDIDEDGESYVCEIDGAYYKVDDWFIDDNLNV